MKATHKYEGRRIAFIKVEFIIGSADLETAIISILKLEEKPTKERIKEELGNMCKSGGADGSYDWVSEEDIETYGDTAKKISQKLFPTFYS